jgi:hypothetical protein
MTSRTDPSVEGEFLKRMILPCIGTSTAKGKSFGSASESKFSKFISLYVDFKFQGWNSCFLGLKNGKTDCKFFVRILAHRPHFQPSQPSKPCPAASTPPQNHLPSHPTPSEASTAADNRLRVADLAIRTTENGLMTVHKSLHL